MPYGRHRNVEFDVPNQNVAFFVERKKLPAVRDVRQSVLEALKKPIASPPFDRMAKKGDKVVVIVDDLTRPTPQKDVLPTVLEQVCSNQVSEDDIEVMVGLGTHRPMTDSEIVARLGPEVAERFTVSNHDYLDEKELVNLGTTDLGIPALVNKTVVDADLVLAVRNIVPHNAAGWGGGAKMILPGVCGEESVGMLHIAAGKVNRSPSWSRRSRTL